MARRVIVKYMNHSEDFHRMTDRHIRSLVKIWAVDDQNVDEDLAELQRRLKVTAGGLDQLLAAHFNCNLLK